MRYQSSEQELTSHEVAEPVGKVLQLAERPVPQMPAWIILLFLGLNIMGCANPSKWHLPKLGIPAALHEFEVKKQNEIKCEQCMAEKGAQRQEIRRLQKLLAEKDAQIRSQQETMKQLQETSSQAAHAQVKLRRLATRPAAASAIAEVEMVLGSLKSLSVTAQEQALQNQAQRLLDAAAVSYAEDNYGGAMDHAAQARVFVDMIKGNRSPKASDQVTVSLQVPILLRTAANTNLRDKPGLSAAVVTVLEKASLMTAEAYRGEWMQVVTVDGRTGWVLNTLVEAQIGKP